jgi:zona occludens toxin
VPDDVQELDTHRHKGVDFILITQSVMNIDRHLHALGGRHLHVRRVGNMKAAIVYEWDHVSRSLQYSKAIAKSAWRYSSKVFKLYKSSELHTKVKRSTPPLLWAVLIGVCVAAWGIPTYIDRMKERTMGGGAAVKTEAQHVSPKASDPKNPAAAHPTQAPAQTAVAAPVEPEKPKIAGCAATATQCVCMTEQGQKIEAEPGYCQSMTAKPKVVLAGGNVDWYKEPSPPPDNSSTWTGTVVGTRKGWQF